jgi:hypothetical protein
METKPVYPRRTFLQHTGLAAGALAIPPVITSAGADQAGATPATAGSAGPPYLVFLPLGSDEPSPAKVFKDRAYIESLPVDGVVMHSNVVVAGAEKIPACIWSNRESIKPAQVLDEAAPLKGKFSKLNRSWFLAVTTMKASDWFSDWSTCVGNFAMMARACRDLGMEGLFLDNTDNQYHPVPIWGYPAGKTKPTRSMEDYRRQVRLRGKQIMEACVREYPAFKLALLNGPALAEKGDPFIEVRPEFSLGTAFYSGLLAGAGETGMVIDASVFYKTKDQKMFAGSYQFRKYEIPSARHNSPSLSTEDRALWTRRLRVGYGLSYGFTQEGMTHALMQSDYVTWYYNGADNLDPETVKEKWWSKDRFPALGAARAAATAAGANNRASGVHFATATGEASVQASAGDPAFRYTLDTDNRTGAPATIEYLEKPAWVKAEPNSAAISGKPPSTARTETLVAVISAAGKSDTIKVALETRLRK